MRLKILRTEGHTEQGYGDFGSKQLYFEGSKRVIVAYFLFPKTIGRERRRGLQFVEQRSSIKQINELDYNGAYNKWENSRFIDASLLETMTAF